MFLYNAILLFGTLKRATMIHTIIHTILDIIESFGYIGIFIFMAIESSILPLPSEVVMIPAGYLVWEGKMSAFIAILSGTLGSLAGALCNYFIAIKIGRIFITKYGKYVFMKEKSLIATEKFFNKHGEISTFVGRLIPVVRHYISLPAGLAKMSLYRFSIFTLLGACIWVSILTAFGFWLGDTFNGININEIADSFGKGELDATQQTIKQEMRLILFGVLGFACVCAGLYIVLHVRIARKSKKRKG